MVMNCAWKCAFFGLVIQITTAKIADYVTPCNADDPQLDECVVKQANIMLPFLAKGVKEFGLLPMEPLSIPLMRMDDGKAGVVGISFNISNSKHYGWQHTQFKKAKVDPKNYRFELEFLNPFYTVIGDYEIKGRILVLPIVGHGFTNLTFVNVVSTMKVEGKPEQRNGKTYMKVTQVKVKYTPGNIKMRLDNLFGNKELSDSLNSVLNDNAISAFEELNPALEELFSELYAELLNRMFSKIPYNQLFKNLN